MTYQSGDRCSVYFPHDDRGNSHRPAVIVGEGYTPDQRRVEYQNGTRAIVHVNFLYPPDAVPVKHRLDERAGEYTAKRGRKPFVNKPAPATQKRKDVVRGSQVAPLPDYIRQSLKAALARKRQKQEKNS